MTIFSQTPTIAELCNLMANHRAGVTVRHVATDTVPGITYHDFVTSDGRRVSVTVANQFAGQWWKDVTMRVEGQGWSDIGAVR